MPRINLTDDQIAEIIDLVAAEIDRVRAVITAAVPHGPDEVEMRHRESVMREIADILEDAG